MSRSLRIEFCGEWYEPDPDGVFAVGRDADLFVDENPYLHRRFLEFSHGSAFWWLSNVGTQVPVTVSETSGAVVSWLTPGGTMPLVFAHTVLRFTAGGTSYEMNAHLDQPAYAAMSDRAESSAATTMGRIDLNGEQRILVIALAEPMLRRGRGEVSSIPSRKECAERLGWTLKKLDRKLDAVCQKLHRANVRGVYGSSAEVALNRRARLVEFSVAAGLVGRDDLRDLDSYVSGEG